MNLLTLQESADLVHVSFPTMRRWIDRGELPVMRLGRVVRVRPEDLEILIESRIVREAS